MHMNDKKADVSNYLAEKEKHCSVKMQDETPCGRELYDDKHCIFHSKKPDKDAKLFQEKLTEIFGDNSTEQYDFSNFIFPAGILFPDKIDKKITFFQAVFQGEADFWGKTFQDETRFHRTTFQREAQFTKVTFQASVIFFKAFFEGETNFEEASFEMVSFDGATFKGRTSFEHTSFESKADFSDAIFKSYASFSGTTFKALTYLIEVTFQNGVNFHAATFGDELVIYEEESFRIFSEKEVDFRYATFLRPEKVTFEKVDLSRFRFLGTDLRKVEFVDVDWDTKRGRNRIYDEIVSHTLTETKYFGLPPLIKKPDYPLIAQVYKRLRMNYEENLNYAEAGDFHIGEMEMRRKGEKNPFNKGIIWLYKLLSNYGESYWRPLLCWILPILLLFPFLFMYSGIERVTQSQSYYRIDYDFNPSSISLDKAGDFIKDYLKSSVYSLSVFSLVREKQYRPIDNWGHFWMVLESIFSPVLIAFFLLALRRRFRR